MTGWATLEFVLPRKEGDWPVTLLDLCAALCSWNTSHPCR